MANGVGFFLQLPNEPSIYISGDTVLTDDVKHVLNDMKQDITVVAAGEAQMDVGKALLMSGNDTLTFILLSPSKVIANHLEALNHCPLERKNLRNTLTANGLTDKVFIPEDGETLTF